MNKSNDESVAIERRIQLEKLITHHDAEGDAPLRVGDEPFRWSTVQTLAESILETISDLNVAVWLLRAQIIQNGLNGLQGGLAKLAELVRRPSTDLHPKTEEDDDEPPAQTHALVLGWLGGEEFLSLIRTIPIDPEHPPRIGDLLLSTGGVAGLPEASKSSACKLLDDARGLLCEIRENISNAGGRWNRDPILAIELISDGCRLLSSVSVLARPKLDKKFNADQTELEEKSETGLSIKSRAEVKLFLNQIEQYYCEMEPAHPAPILINRLKKMVDASFEEILKELYVDAPILISRIANPLGHI